MRIVEFLKYLKMAEILNIYVVSETCFIGNILLLNDMWFMHVYIFVWHIHLPVFYVQRSERDTGHLLSFFTLVF